MHIKGFLLLHLNLGVPSWDVKFVDVVVACLFRFLPIFFSFRGVTSDKYAMHRVGCYNLRLTSVQFFYG